MTKTKTMTGKIRYKISPLVSFDLKKVSIHVLSFAT